LFAGWATASVQSKLKGWLDPSAVWIPDLWLACCGTSGGLFGQERKNAGGGYFCCILLISIGLS